VPWKKNSPEAVRRFDDLCAVKGAARGLLFGCPMYSIAGERYAVLHQDTIALRLSEKDTAAVLAAGGRPFEPMPGRLSQERVVLPAAIAKDAKKVRALVLRAVKYAKG
jgi:hypothetical protein